MPHDKQETLTEMENGMMRLKVKLTRGDGVRDQDEITGELVADSLDELKEDLEEFHHVVYGEANRARSYDPK